MRRGRGAWREASGMDKGDATSSAGREPCGGA